MKHTPYIISIGCDRILSVIGTMCVALLFVIASAMPAMANQGAPSSGGSVLNILFLGLIAYFLVRMFRRRSGGGRDDKTRPGNWTQTDSNDDEQQGKVIRPMDRHEAARQMWGHLSSDKPEPTTPSAAPAPETGGAFDENEFLEGAKLFFTRVQTAQEKEDIDQLRGFLSDEAYSEIAPFVSPERTEIMLLNARLMEVKSEGGRTFSTVFYDGQMRRGAAGEHTEHIRVVWEFSRDDMAENGLWTLEKINKVDQ